jgi:hypothetical protein
MIEPLGRDINAGTTTILTNLRIPTAILEQVILPAVGV